MKLNSLIRIYITTIILSSIIIVSPTAIKPSYCYSPNEVDKENSIKKNIMVQKEADTSIPLDEKSTLADYLQYAFYHTPEISAAIQHYLASLQQVPQARALPEPMLEFGYFVHEIEAQQYNLSLSQTLPWFGKLSLKEDIATGEAGIAYEEYHSAWLEVAFQIKKIYYELSYLNHLLDINRENLRLLGELEEIVLTNYKVNLAKFTDLLKLQMQISNLEENISYLKDLKSSTEIEFKTILNCSLETKLSEKMLLPEEKVIIPPEQNLAEILKANPELLDLNQQILVDQNQIRLADKDYYPDLTFGLNYESSSPDMSVDNSGKNPIMASISLNLPIWRGRLAAQKEAAQFQLKSTENMKQSKLLELENSVSKIRYEIKEAQRKMDLYKNILIPKVWQTFELEETEYKVGKANFSDLIETQQSMLEFQQSFCEALKEQAQKFAEFEFLTAQDDIFTP